MVLMDKNLKKYDFVKNWENNTMDYNKTCVITVIFLRFKSYDDATEFIRSCHKTTKLFLFDDWHQLHVSFP